MRTTDEINAMTLPELRAAVAFDLGLLSAIEGVPLDLFDSPHRLNWKFGQHNPGGWLGVVDDAMIARGWEPTSDYNTDTGTWTVEYWKWDSGSSAWLVGKADGPNREDVALTSALEAEAAAKGGNA